MTAVGELVLVLGLLVSTHCEVRARDPEEEEEMGGRGRGGGGGFPPHLERLHPGATETPLLGERRSYPACTGNWCAFVQKRVVTMAVACRTEKYTINSQSLCPSGTPDCQLVLYKLSTRPIYRQKQQILTALLCRCCPGHGGHNCEDTVSDAQLDSGSSALIGGAETARSELHPLVSDAQLDSGSSALIGGAETARSELHPPVSDAQLDSGSSALIGGAETARSELHPPGVQQQRVDPNREQNDHQAPVSRLHYDQHTTTSHAHNSHHTPHHAAKTHDHRGHERHPPDEADVHVALPVPHMMALVMSQLQPLLEGFNHSLEQLRGQVGDLARDVAHLKSSRLELQRDPLGLHEEAAAEERLDAKLDEVFQQVREVQREVEHHRAGVENRLHSQHAMLHYNLTSFKTDIDMKLKRHQKMLQVSLQAMNATLAELQLDQDQPTEARLPPSEPPFDTSVLWDAIERLDNMVVNNTVTVGGLVEDMDVSAGYMEQLRRNFKELEKQINRTARTSQVQFMETGLEVEAARETVLRRVGELAGNLSQQGEQLQEMDVDVDYLYTALYKHNTSGDCDCKGLRAAVARLEGGVANVTELANENRLALDENAEGGAGQWGGASDWEPAVEALQRGLQQVKESLASEQTRTGTLDRGLAQLRGSLSLGLADIAGLKEADRKLAEDMRRLSSSFNSLLKDAIRHSDVLELLLGEEVLEFLEWPVQDQESHSIPALKEQLRRHNLSITSLLGNRPAGREEVPSADQPSSHLLPGDWPPGSLKRSSDGAPVRERQVLLHPAGRRPEHRGDGSDLWNLEKRVEELGLKVLRLEDKHSNVSKERAAPPGGVEAGLQAEVTWLKRGLEEHLRMFKNVFSNADVLAGSGATLELDKLWHLVKNKDGKKKRGGNHRSRRESSGVVPVPSGQSEDSLLLVATSPLRVSNGVMAFEASLNRGHVHSDAGTFTAPVDGLYLFVLTLDLRPGPAHVVLRRRSGAAPLSLHRQEVTEAGPVVGAGLLPLSEGEEAWLELKGGAWAESEDNVFAVLLLHRTT